MPRWTESRKRFSATTYQLWDLQWLPLVRNTLQLVSMTVYSRKGDTANKLHLSCFQVVDYRFLHSMPVAVPTSRNFFSELVTFSGINSHAHKLKSSEKKFQEVGTATGIE